MFENFIRDGGFGMYPTLVFGALAVVAAVVIAARPQRRFVPLVLALGACTFGSGMLGTVVGFITSLRYVAKAPDPDRMTFMMIGAAESMNNMVLALICVVLAALIASVAAARIALGHQAEAASRSAS